MSASLELSDSLTVSLLLAAPLAVADGFGFTGAVLDAFSLVFGGGADSSSLPLSLALSLSEADSSSEASPFAATLVLDATGADSSSLDSVSLALLASEADVDVAAFLVFLVGCATESAISSSLDSLSEPDSLSSLASFFALVFSIFAPLLSASESDSASTSILSPLSLSLPLSLPLSLSLADDSEACFLAILGLADGVSTFALDNETGVVSTLVGVATAFFAFKLSAHLFVSALTDALELSEVSLLVELSLSFSLSLSTGSPALRACFPPVRVNTLGTMPRTRPAAAAACWERVPMGARGPAMGTALAVGHRTRTKCELQ